MTKGKPELPVVQQQPGSPHSRFEQRRAKILDAATLLLNQRGIAGMTLQEVAEQLGLKPTAITYYFRYKEQLVAAVFEDSLQRLMAMVETASALATPRERVNRYLAMHFDHYAAALRGDARPLAILSELRALDGEARTRLIGEYQKIFRAVRALFGPADTAAQKLQLTPRAQILNEVIYWSAIWLKHYDIADFDTVRRQLFRILDKGIAARPREDWHDLPCTNPAVSAGDSYALFLKIATRSLNDVGYKGTSIKRIAAELNLTKGSFYHHLPTKDELILQCFHNSYQRLRDIYEQATNAGASKWETLISILAQAIRYQFEGDYPLLRTTAFQALPDSVRQIPYDHSQRTTLLFAGLLVDAAEEGFARNLNPLLASHIIMAAVNSASDVRSWAAKQDLQTAVADYLSALTDGIFPSA